MGNNIAIPYSGHINGGIQVGTDVVISGRVPMNCSRFSLNLCVGQTYDQDCALHFNPRLDDNKVVRNHMQGGSWGNEETSGGFPFRKGMHFEIHMKANHHAFKITVNNRHFCDFNYRLPRESVQYLYIEGDVIVTYIQFRGGHPQPSGVPGGYPNYPPAVPGAGAGYPPAPNYPSAPGYPSGGAFGPIFNPQVPFTTPIQGGVVPGRIVFISGIPNPTPSRFSLNMQCGPYDSGDFALHFDVRFNYGNCVNQVVRTHKQRGGYGPEEKDITFFPFYPNTPFEMMILIEPASFKIAVNNQHFVEFYHRIQPFNRADHVHVMGDVRLTQVRFQ